MSASNAPLVSFVVLCYNHERYIGECLRAIFDQQGEHAFEVIVVDDASTDGSQEIIRSFRDPRLRVIAHQTNVGHARTVNEALALARGAFVARIDGDDRYRPHYLSTVLERFHSYPSVGLVYGDVALIDERGAITQRHGARAYPGRDVVGNELVRLLKTNFICAPTVIARREAWLKALPVPDHLAFHDWWFTVLMARAWDFCYVDDELADYRVHPHNYHATIIRNGSEEPSIFWLLDRVFSESERDPELEAKKQQSRRRIYAAHYLTLADKYFGFRMDADARRCYLSALRRRPDLLGRPDVLRHLFGALAGHTRYERIKALVKRRMAPSTLESRLPQP
jgi:glycosyltransferase involved in cell wall biosynthesis